MWANQAEIAAARALELAQLRLSTEDADEACRVMVLFR